MAGHTNRLSLYKPGGGSTGVYVPDEQADIDKINSNMDLIDAAIGGPSYTSATRPASPYDGELIFETDTKNLKIFSVSLGQWLSASNSARGIGADYFAATPAALQAISDMTAGDAAYLAGDVTNFTSAVFIYNGSKWTSPVVRFTTAAGAMAAFVTYLNLATNTNIVMTSGTGTIATGASLMPIPVYSNGTRWARQGVIPPPASAPVGVVITGTSFSIDDLGVTTLTAVTVATFQNVIPTLAQAGSRRIRIKINGTLATAGTVSLKTATAGTAEGANTNCDWYGPGSTQAGVASNATSLAQASWPISNGFSGTVFDFRLNWVHAGEALATDGDYYYKMKTAVALGTAQEGAGTVDHRAAVMFDGINLVFSTAFTGQVSFEILED